MDDIQIRWLIRRDMDEVLHIERESFDYPWTEDDFLSCLRQRNAIRLVAEKGFRSKDYMIVGFIVFEIHARLLNIANFAVSKDYRRNGVGTKIVHRMKGKLSIERRVRLTLNVRETNLPSQLFFQSCGFMATGIVRNPYEYCSEDAISMEYRIEAGQLQST